MDYSENILLIGNVISLHTNDINVINHVRESYFLCKEISYKIIEICRCNSIQELMAKVFEKHYIKLSLRDEMGKNYESRKISDSFLVRIFGDGIINIYYFIFEKNDIMEYIHSVIEYAILSFVSRNRLIIHGALVEYNKHAILFSGESGSGKTTMSLLAINKGANFIENEHTIVAYEQSLKIYKTSQNIRVKEEAVEKTKSLINYNKKFTMKDSNPYKSLTLVFLKFGKHNLKKLNETEKIQHLFSNIVRVNVHNSIQIVNNLKKLCDDPCVHAYTCAIEKDNYFSSQQLIEEIIGEVNNEKN